MSDSENESESQSYEEVESSDEDYESPKTKKSTTKKPPTKTAPKKTAPKKNTSTKETKKLEIKEKDEEDDMDDDDDETPVKNKTSKSSGISKNAVGKEKPIEEVYTQLSLREQILLRPDTYIGSTELATDEMWVWDETSKKMVFRKITYSPGLYKIFDEIMVNAADNKQRDQTMDAIKVDIDKEEGSISIWNNGAGIPCEIHKKHNIYVVEMIFGNLLTSSNYNDDQKKVTGGRNGYGAKLCNIFSNSFTVESYDHNKEKLYVQTWTDNMEKKGKAKITTKRLKSGDYTKITFKPDFPRFKMNGLTDDMIALLQKRVMDIAGCSEGVKVNLNSVRVPVTSFQKYVDLYPIPEKKNGGKYARVYEKCHERWEVCVTVCPDGDSRQVSFVNSIATIDGGSHVKHILDSLVKKLGVIFTKNNKAAPIKPAQIRSHLWVFVNCLIENPVFNSQRKNELTSSVKDFGSRCKFSEEFIKKVAKSGLEEAVVAFATFKASGALKRLGGKKSKRITGVEKLDDANKAGTASSSKCTLILTEGDSAKTLAISGLEREDRDYYGVFPLRGKFLNVREATHSQIMKNEEVKALQKILGLTIGKKYESINELRYGKVMIMTDQDHDGSHIKGLLINFFHHFWPDLIHKGFIREFITPIVRATKKNSKSKMDFYTIPEYENWKSSLNENQLKQWQIMYYKGLGTSSDKEAKEYFSNITKHRIDFVYKDKEDDQSIDLVFNKKKSDERKEWLQQYQPGSFLDTSSGKVRYKTFINDEFRLFSIEDNKRSIPSLVDGLKPGHRKILHGCFKRKLTKKVKVAQLSGYISEHTAYHHGEQSLQTTIIGMAQNFVGSNNINLLYPYGQFGSRREGGKDAASARYTHTKLCDVTRHIFNPDDDALLNYLDDDGLSIEPDYFVPIIPMVLVNGASGIGTGWSTTIPNYNPLEIIKNLRLMIEGEEDKMEEMHPWYRGFNGTIKKNSLKEKSYDIFGNFTWEDDSTIHVSELPIEIWTQTYKEFLEKHIVGANSESSKIKEYVIDYNDNSTSTVVDFTVSIATDLVADLKKKGFEKSLKLKSSIATSNLVLFDQHGKIKKYDNITQILKEFYEIRLDFYGKRKDHLLSKLQKEFDMMDNKVRFLLAIIEGKLVINKKKKKDLVKELAQMKFTPFPKESKKKKVVGDENESEDSDEKDEVDENAGSDGGYDYLLKMPLWNLTYEKIEQLKKLKTNKMGEIEDLNKKSPKDLWLNDLAKLEVAIKEHFEDIESINANDKKGKKKSSTSRKLMKGTTGKEVKKEVKKTTTKKEAPSKSPTKTKKPTKTTTKKETTKKTSGSTSDKEDISIESPRSSPRKKTDSGAPKKQTTIDKFLKPKEKQSEKVVGKVKEKEKETKVVKKEESESDDDDLSISMDDISFDKNITNISNISADDPLSEILITPDNKDEKKRKRLSNESPVNKKSQKKKVEVDDEDSDSLLVSED